MLLLRRAELTEEPVLTLPRRRSGNARRDGREYTQPPSFDPSESPWLIRYITDGREKETINTLIEASNHIKENQNLFARKRR